MINSFAKHMRGWFMTGAMVASLAAPPLTARAGAPSFQGLGAWPHVPPYSEAYGVSADGSVVVGLSYSFFYGREAFRWTSEGGMVNLGALPGGDPFNTSSKGLGVSPDGSVVVGARSSTLGSEAFLWTSDGDMIGLGDLPGGISSSEAVDASAYGSVIVGNGTSASGDEAFRWTSEAGMVGLGDLPGGGFYSEAFGVSADGSVVVGFSKSASGDEAFRWTLDDGMIGLGDLPGGPSFSQAWDVSADGSIVVGISRSTYGTEAFLWTSDEGMIGLGDLPSPGTIGSGATGVSADGSVVVGLVEYSGSGLETFIWDAVNGMRSLKNVLEDSYGLDLTGWTLRNATGISDDGKTIVGTGRNPSGDFEAWIAHIPEPATMWLLALGGLSLLGRRRQCHGK